MFLGCLLKFIGTCSNDRNYFESAILSVIVMHYELDKINWWMLFISYKIIMHIFILFSPFLKARKSSFCPLISNEISKQDSNLVLNYSVPLYTKVLSLDIHSFKEWHLMQISLSHFLITEWKILQRVCVFKKKKKTIWNALLFALFEKTKLLNQL